MDWVGPTKMARHSDARVSATNVRMTYLLALAALLLVASSKADLAMVRETAKKSAEQALQELAKIRQQASAERKGNPTASPTVVQVKVSSAIPAPAPSPSAVASNVRPGQVVRGFIGGASISSVSADGLRMNITAPPQQRSTPCGLAGCGTCNSMRLPPSWTTQRTVSLR